MPSTRATAPLPTLPTGSEVALKDPAYHSPLDKFIAAHEPGMTDGRQARVWWGDLQGALDFYADRRQSMRIEQRLLERREEIHAGFDSNPVEPRA